MKKSSVVFATLFASLAIAVQNPAHAQNASPQQIQTMIANGQEQAALNQLQGALQAHPDSGVAWYLTAEAQDASGNESAARSALANAQHYAPGLPFAHADDVAALQSHLNNAPGSVGMARPHSGFSPTLIGIIFFVALFLGLRMLFRRRRVQPGYPTAYGPAGGVPPYGGPGFGGNGFGGNGFGGGGFGGSGLGGSLLGGLAAGAGFAAGERVIDDVFGRNNGNSGGNFQQDDNFGNGNVPDRDDGLSGNPGWNDGSNNQDNNFDSGNSW